MTASPLARDREHILAESGALWEPLRGARVFVTGGTGFVGTWLVEAFAAANAAHALGARAVLLTRDPARFAARAPHLAADPAVELLAGEATTFVAPPGSFAYVIHAATHAYRAPDPAEPLSVLAPDLVATRRVLALAAERGAQRALFTSSGAVYGTQPPALAAIPEEYPGAPDVTDAARAAYGESKRVGEYAFAAYGSAHGFAATIARLFAFVGPHLPLDANYAAGNFLADVLAQRPIAIGGDGTPYRSYLYAADLAVWLWTILLRGAPGRAYNVGSPEAVSIRTLAERVAALVPGTEVRVARAPVAGAPAARYVPSTARAESELGLRIAIPLDDALRRTYDYHRHAGRMTAAP